MRRLRLKSSTLRRVEKNSPDSEFCSMCFEAVESSNQVATEKTEKLIISTYNYLQSGIKSKYYDIADLENKRLLYCKNCFDCALKLTQLTEQRNTLEDEDAKINLEKEIADLTSTFSLAVINRRDMFHNNISNNKTLETNESGSELKGIPSLFLLDGCSTANSINGKEHSVPDIVNEHENTDCEDDQFSLGYSLSSAVEEVENVDLNINDLDQTNQEETLQEERETVITKAPVPVSPYTRIMTNAEILKTIRMPSVTVERFDGKKVKMTTENTTKEHRTLNPIQLEGVLQRSQERKRRTKQTKSADLNSSKRPLRSTVQINEIPSVVVVKTRLQSNRPIITKKQRKIPRVYLYKCCRCFLIFHRVYLLKYHYKKYHLKRVLKNKEGLKCSICQKKLSYPPLMKTHMAFHDKQEHKCGHCKKIFSNPNNLERHVRLHGLMKLYKCTFCNEGFRNKSGWAKHLQIHAKEKSFKSTRAQHQNIHSGAKSYKCPLCPESFQRASARKKHYLKIHKKGEKRLNSQRSCKK